MKIMDSPWLGLILRPAYCLLTRNNAVVLSSPYLRKKTYTSTQIYNFWNSLRLNTQHTGARNTSGCRNTLLLFCDHNCESYFYFSFTFWPPGQLANHRALTHKEHARAIIGAARKLNETKRIFSPNEEAGILFMRLTYKRAL